MVSLTNFEFPFTHRYVVNPINPTIPIRGLRLAFMGWFMGWRLYHSIPKSIGFTTFLSLWIITLTTHKINPIPFHIKHSLETMVVFIIIMNIITSLLSSCVSFHSSHDDDDVDDDDHHVQLFVLNRCCDYDEQLIGLLIVVWNIFFHFIYGMSSFPLTNSMIFQRGGEKPPTRWCLMFVTWYSAR